MTFSINNKQFSGKISSKLVQQMTADVRNAPEPKVMPRKDGPSNNEIGICLQREIYYTDGNTNVPFIGSKEVYSCIVMYLHSSTDHAVIHVDHVTDSIDMDKILSLFKNKKDIQVDLVGGCLYGDFAEKNLSNIVTTLYNAAEKHNININIAHQKILKSNVFTNEDRQYFVYDRIIMKLDMLSRQYFKKPFNLEKLSKGVDDFNIKLDPNNPNSKHARLLIDLIGGTCEVYDASSQKKERNKLVKDCQGIIRSEENFYKVIEVIFSKEGFDLLDDYYQSTNSYLTSKLIHFVFDIRNGNIYPISKNTKTPYEEQRAVSIFDSSNRTYFLCYDGEKYFKPTLSKQFLNNCDQFKDQVTAKGSFVNTRNLAYTFSVSPQFPTITMIAKFIKKYADNTLDVIEVNHASNKVSNIHVNEKSIATVAPTAAVFTVVKKDPKDYSPRDIADLFLPQQSTDKLNTGSEQRNTR